MAILFLIQSVGTEKAGDALMRITMFHAVLEVVLSKFPGHGGAGYMLPMGPTPPRRYGVFAYSWQAREAEPPGPLLQLRCPCKSRTTHGTHKPFSVPSLPCFLLRGIIHPHAEAPLIPASSNVLTNVFTNVFTVSSFP